MVHSYLFMGTSTQNAPGAALFGKARLTLLSFFYLRPNEAFYVREIMRRVALPPSNVQRELGILHGAGLIERSLVGRHVYYRAASNSPIFTEVRGIIVKTSGLADVLRECLQPVADKIRLGFVFGSVARGEQISSSDIDLLVVGEVTFRDIVERLAAAERDLGREISPTVYSEKEFKAKVLSGLPFVMEIIQKPKIFVIGNERELRAMGKVRVSGKA
jgi:uncharacterized protein